MDLKSFGIMNYNFFIIKKFKLLFIINIILLDLNMNTIREHKKAGN